MQKDTIDDLFEDLNGAFDVNEPNEGHEHRFLEKLKATNIAVNDSNKSFRYNWKPFLAIAASVVICLSTFIAIQNQSEALDLASVSPELSQTQDFFTATIENELRRLNKERSPLTEQLITDALAEIKLLESEYQNLKTNLREIGSDQRLIQAMISNFQSRITILNTVLEDIEIIKNLKAITNDTKNTL